MKLINIWFVCHLYCFVSFISTWKSLSYEFSLAKKMTEQWLKKDPSHALLFSLFSNHKLALTVYFDWQSHFLPPVSFWPFSELNKRLSLIPSSSVSWLRFFVCWDNEFFTRAHSSTGFSSLDFVLPLSTAVRCNQRESESKLWSANSFISLTHLRLTLQFERTVPTCILFTAACLCLDQKFVILPLSLGLYSVLWVR